MSPFFGKPQRGILSHKLKQCISHKLLYTVRKPVNPLVQYYVKKKKKSKPSNSGCCTCKDV